jgi:hypothetical protein
MSSCSSFIQSALDRIQFIESLRRSIRPTSKIRSNCLIVRPWGIKIPRKKRIKYYMAMIANNKGIKVPNTERKKTLLITSDMVLDLYEKAKKAKGQEKKELMERVVFLSEHLNHYTSIVESLYL